MRQTQSTSIESYRNLPHIGEDQQTVLIAIHAYPDCTDRELCEKLGIKDPNKLRPRRKELADMNKIICSGKRVCTVSGRKAMVWRLK